MKNYSYLLFLIIVLFSCGKFDDATPISEKEKLELSHYFIDEDLKLILSNVDLNNFSFVNEIEEFILGESYTLIEPTNSLEIGKEYLVEKNNITYKLFFTELPILSINSNNTISDEPKTLATAEFISLDTEEHYFFKMGIEIRGGSSQFYPKKSYGFEIWEDDLGANSKDLSFLNMREDDDWILDGMYNSPLRSRNLVGHRIWKEIHTPHYLVDEPNAKSTVQSEFIEIFINKKYQGIYALSERPDRKLLKLKKYNGEIRGEMYKGISWSNALFTGIENYDNSSRVWGGFELEYPTENEITDWSKVYEFVDFVVNSSDQEFINEISNKIHTGNFIDYFIFLNMIRASDNTGKNIFLSKYNQNTSYFYVPWDLDGILGNQWEGNRDVVTNDILSNGLYDRLLELNPDNFQTKLNNRWTELSTNQLSTSNILAKFQNEIDHLQQNAVYNRENMAWNFNYQEDDYIYMSNWINERWSYLNDFFQ